MALNPPRGGPVYDAALPARPRGRRGPPQNALGPPGGGCRRLKPRKAATSAQGRPNRRSGGRQRAPGAGTVRRWPRGASGRGGGDGDDEDEDEDDDSDDGYEHGKYHTGMAWETHTEEENANLVPVAGNWRERVSKRRKEDDGARAGAE